MTYSAKSSEVGEHEGTFTALDDVVISSGEDNMTANYDISFASGVLTIEQDPKLEFEATLAGASFAYDGKPHALPTGATDNALSGTTAFEYSKDGKSWTADLPSLTVTDVTDSCTIQVRASNPNYTNAATCEAKLSVEPVKATIKVDNATKVTGEADPTFTGKVEGLAADGDLGKVKFVRIGNDEGVGAYKGVLTAEYTPNANYEVTVENGDFTITAKPAVKGTLTFNLGGGTLDGKTGTITIEANVGDTIKLPGAPTKDGYTFKCWRGSEYAAGADYKVEGDHAFTAEWEKSEPAPVVKHMVTFDANGHGKAPAAQEVEDGETIEKPSDPTADDYTFDGWYADKECTKAYVFSTPVTEDITLYAKWTKKSSTNGTSRNGTSTGSSSSTAKTGDTIGWTAAAFALVGACALCLALLALSRRNRRD